MRLAVLWLRLPIASASASASAVADLRLRCLAVQRPTSRPSLASDELARISWTLLLLLAGFTTMLVTFGASLLQIGFSGNCDKVAVDWSLAGRQFNSDELVRISGTLSSLAGFTTLLVTFGASLLQIGFCGNCDIVAED